MPGMESKPGKIYKFQARIEPAGGGGAYVFFPFDTQQEFGTRSKVPIQARIAGIPYTGSLTPYGQPQHILHISKAIRQQSGKDIGDTIEVELWKDEQVRTLEVPRHFHSLLEQEELLPFFESLSYTHRKEYVRWVTEAKTEATNARRLAKAVEMLKQRVKTPE
jgi:hypothetical protein